MSQKHKFIKDIRGKTVEKIVTGNDEDQVFIDIQFQDKTSCAIYIGPAQIEVESAEVLGWKAGNSFVIRKLL